MRESTFNVWSIRPEGDFVYNALSGAILRTPAGTRTRITNETPLSTCLMSALEAGRMIQTESTSELEMLRNRYTHSARTSHGLSLTVVSSLACNLDCPYCYESKTPRIVRDDVADAIVAYVGTRARNHGLKSLSIHWLGGEPLIGLKPLLSISRRLLDICATHHIDYQSDITTNGVLLNATFARTLAEHSISHAQVSLDGPKRIHDVMRPTKAGKGSFDKIIDNIEQSMEHIGITVRVNLDTSNVAYYNELLSSLSSRGLSGKIGVYAGQLVKVDDGNKPPSSTYTNACFNSKEFSAVDREFTAAASKVHLDRHGMPQPIGTPCTAVRDHDFVVGTEGELYKCWKSVGNTDQSVGSIFDWTALNEHARTWASYDPFEDSDCVKCPALPVCMGGCAHHSMSHSLNSSRCNAFRWNHEHQFNSFVDSYLKQ